MFGICIANGVVARGKTPPYKASQSTRRLVVVISPPRFGYFGAG